MKLPRFVIIENPLEDVFNWVMDTEHPYLFGKAYAIRKKKADEVESMIAAIANDRVTAVKVDGYSVFLMAAGTLESGRMPREDVIGILRDMAAFYKEAVLDKKGARFAEYEEGVPDDYYTELNKEYIRRRAEYRRRKEYQKAVDARRKADLEGEETGADD